jgi:hypothetical protein
VATFSAALLERTYSTADVVEQRARIRAKVAPKHGEHGLDIGCGPGLLACELARDVGPSGRMVGIDRLSMGRDVCRARGFADGDAMVNLHSDDTTYSGLIDVVARFVGSHRGRGAGLGGRRPGQDLLGRYFSLCIPLPGRAV